MEPKRKDFSQEGLSIHLHLKQLLGVIQFQRLKQYSRNCWIFPRYISKVYMNSALGEARKYAHGVLLDIGCGLRQYEGLFSENITRYIGIDRPALGYKAKQDLICDALNLPIRTATLDTVLATELMEHLSDPNQFLTEVSRILRAGGSFILSVPFMEPIHEEPRDYYRFTHHSLYLLLEQHGFLVKELWAKGGWWSVVLGSFLSQSLYGFVRPDNRRGWRRYIMIGMVVVLPICALLQVIAYLMDKCFHTPRYTLGFVVVGIKKPHP